MTDCFCDTISMGATGQKKTKLYPCAQDNNILHMRSQTLNNRTCLRIAPNGSPSSTIKSSVEIVGSDYEAGQGYESVEFTFENVGGSEGLVAFLNTWHSGTAKTTKDLCFQRDSHTLAKLIEDSDAQDLSDVGKRRLRLEYPQLNNGVVLRFKHAKDPGVMDELTKIYVHSDNVLVVEHNDTADIMIIVNGKEFRFTKDGDIVNLTAGKGIILKTPDGTKNYRVYVDNSGNVRTVLVW